MIEDTLRQAESKMGKAIEVAKEEFFHTKEQIRLEAERLSQWGGSPWIAVFKKPSYRKRMVIGFLTQWGAEFGGPLIIVSSVAVGSIAQSLTGIEQLRCSSVHQPRHDRINALAAERRLVDHCW